MKRRQRIARVLSIFLMMALIAPAFVVPAEVHAASKKKWKYSVKVTNINSNRVLTKGSKFKIAAKGQKKKGSKVKKAKLKYKSSNKKVATVSKKGVIKAKKNGTTKITVYCKAKKSAKKTITVRVGKQVSNIKISGYMHLRPSNSTTLKTTISPSSAKNKKVTWSSGSSSIVSVNSSGKITAKKVGVAEIYAKAVDGSGVVGSCKVLVFNPSATDIKWIAHRGLNTEATENTAKAFRLAGEKGFWGAECDIWETMRYGLELENMPKLPEDQANDEIDLTEDESREVANLESAIEGIDPDNYIGNPSATSALRDSMDLVKILDKGDSIKAAKNAYDKMSVKQKVSVKKDKLEFLLIAYALMKQDERYDLVINHDSTYSRVFEDERYVWEVSSEEAKQTVDADVCFLGEYLSICKTYNMVPVIEIKGSEDDGVDITYEGVRKVVDQIVSTGGYAMLSKCRFVSFRRAALNRVKTYIEYYKETEEAKNKDVPSTYNPHTSYLIKTDVETRIAKGAEYGYSSVGLKYTLLNDSTYNSCISKGLEVNTWTYDDDAEGSENIYQHFLSGKYKVETATVNGKLFK